MKLLKLPPNNRCPTVVGYCTRLYYYNTILGVFVTSALWTLYLNIYAQKELINENIRF